MYTKITDVAVEADGSISVRVGDDIRILNLDTLRNLLLENVQSGDFNNGLEESWIALRFYLQQLSNLITAEIDTAKFSNN